MSPNLHPPRRGLLGFLLDFHNRTILLQVGQFILVTYGVVAGLAFFAAAWGAFWYSAALGYNLNDLMIFYSCFLLPSVLVGARAFSILLEWRQLFVDPIRTLIKPGYMLHGGVFGGTVALFVYGAFGPYSTLSLMDAWGLMMPLGEAVIRLGCYVYGCCWGKPTESNYGIAYTSPHSKVIRCAPHLHGVKIHPSQVYATLAHGIQFALFCMLLSHKAFDGMFAGLYMLTHPIIRVLLERFRQDDRGKLIGPFTHTNLYSLVQMLIGVGMLIVGAQIGANTPLNLALPIWSVLSHTPTLIVCSVIGTIAMLAFGLHFGKVGSWVTSAQGHAPTTACDHAHSAEDPQFGGE